MQQSVSNNNIVSLLSSDLAFAIWRNPLSTNVNVVCCNNSQVLRTTDFNQIDQNSGFVFAPFEVTSSTPICIFPQQSTCQPIGDFIKLDQGNNCNCATQTEYIATLKHLIGKLNNSVPKVVLSRCQWIENIDIVKTLVNFSELLNCSHNLFVYCVRIPNIGCWIGATPETLLTISNGQAETCALAGTMPFTNGKANWSEKEINEQKIVSDFICNTLLDNNIEFSQSPTCTTVAGKLAHLKTTFNFNAQQINGQLGKLLQQLHPTPAVCGLPTDAARNIIAEMETYNRSYYAGFVGLASNNSTQLYVNIRCMQLFANGALLYAGGGITAQSDPTNEWIETEMKMESIAHIISKKA